MVALSSILHWADIARGDELSNNPTLNQYILQRLGEFEQIPDQRQLALQQLAQYVEQQLAAGRTAQLTFICTVIDPTLEDDVLSYVV